MSHPTREVRLQRSIALLDVYDRLRAGEDISRAELACLLRINKSDASRLWRHILVERLGRDPIEPEYNPDTISVPVGPVPAPPEGLTPMERRIYALLSLSMGRAISPGYIYAIVTNTPEDCAGTTTMRTHLANMRRKGARIRNERGMGYWLEPEVSRTWKADPPDTGVRRPWEGVA